MKLAHNVQSAMVDTLNEDYSKVVDLGVKYALFYVLVGAEMPSVLVEISFISNSVEEHRLSKKNYQYRIAEAIAKGIQTYTVPSKIVMRASGNI
jgi:N-acetylmuramoyl-L-alanine amidase